MIVFYPRTGSLLVIMDYNLQNTESQFVTNCCQQRKNTQVWNPICFGFCFLVGQQIRGQIVGRNLGTVQYTSFSPDDGLLALCIEQEIHIFNVQVQNVSYKYAYERPTILCSIFVTVDVTLTAQFCVKSFYEKCRIFMSPVRVHARTHDRTPICRTDIRPSGHPTVHTVGLIFLVFSYILLITLHTLLQGVNNKVLRNHMIMTMKCYTTCNSFMCA